MSVHPKIQVESRANIEFLIQECVNFAYNHTNKSNEKQASLQHITRVVQRLFLSAGNCIEINKVPFHEAFQTKKEYEPIDEQLVEETRAAQHRVQQKLLELTTLRKRVPQMIRTTRDTIDLDEEMDIHEDVITLALSNSNYIKTCAIKQDLKKNTLGLKENAEKLETLLDDLKIPQINSTDCVQDIDLLALFSK